MPTSNTLLPTAELQEVFPSPTLRYQWPDSDKLNAELKALIIAKVQAKPGELRSIAGGMQSDRNVQDWPEPCVKQLLGRIDTMVRELVLRVVDNPRDEHLEGWKKEVWANINRNGNYNRSHDHTRDNNLWSGIYYVEPGFGADGKPESAGGRTQFEDSAGVPVALGPTGEPALRDFSVQPRAGLMILFPGHLRHRVDPYLGQDARITVAFNLRHHAFTVPSVADRVASESDFMWKNFRGVMIAASYGRNAVRKALKRG